MSRIAKLRLGLCGSFLALATVSMPAIAQDQPAPAQGTDDQTAESTEASSGEGTIVVTGSRIRRTEFNSPDPITVIDPTLGLKQGQSETVELINTSPIAAGSIQITSAISTNFVTNGGADAQTVSLRGLGAERTLVLLNGRRAGPAGVRGGVSSFDLNVLPTSIVRSIEILKTGASSIYGSDAIAGVVNILTRKETDGVEFRGFVSAPEKGGAEVYSLGTAFGKEFDRGVVGQFENGFYA
jgi:iron complex outermembrane recepter protein